MKIPKVRFVLKSSKGPEESLIYLIIRYDKQKLVYSTGVKIIPELWDKKSRSITEDKELLKKYPVMDDHLSIVKIELNKHKTALEGLLIMCKVNDHIPVPEKLKLMLDDKLNKKRSSSSRYTFFTWIDHFIKTTKRRAITIKGYKTTQNHLIEFQKVYNRRIDFDTIDLDFYDEFVQFFNDKNSKANTIGKNVKNLKVFLNEAAERGYHNNMIFRHKKFKVQEEDTDQIYLTEEEILKIYNLDLTNKRRLDRVRDIFVAACYTGLRFADLNQINVNNIKEEATGNLLKVMTRKTGETVVIPLNDIVKIILEKNNGELPRIPTNQKFNESLKDLGELAEINEKIPITSTKGGLPDSESVPKYIKITTHTARRSFSTNAFLADIPVISIMKITGHRTEKSFLKYIRIDNEENAKKLLNHSFFNKSHKSF